MKRIVLALLVVAALVACQTKPDATKREPTACKKFGDTCELSPGKLGTCVQKTDCSAAEGCLVCQSQH